jgi:hypothetical protein
MHFDLHRELKRPRRREHKRRQPVAIVIIGEPADTVWKWSPSTLTLTDIQMSETTND